MSDCCSAPGLMPFEIAKDTLLANLPLPSKTQVLALEDSLDRVLTQNLISPVFVPPHNNSAMDGYAYHSSSLKDNPESLLNIVGRSFAGEPFTGQTQAGECIRIMTGAKLPSCCDTVVMQENTERQADVLRITKIPKETSNVRYQGEDIRQGESVFTQGHKIRGVDIGLLASLGVAKVEVFQPLTVAILSTGDELKSPGEVLTDGDIFESNRFALKAVLQRLGVNIRDLGIIPDDKQAIRDAFINADANADVVISSGGVSVGEADYTKDILEELGEIDFWKIAMKPGKPFAFGRLPNSVFFGLPGNPVSAIATFYLLSVPGIEKMQGKTLVPAAQFSAITTTALRKGPGRKDFQRGFVSYNELGQAVVTSTGAQGSGILSSIGNANCFIVLEQDQGGVEAGESVTVEMFSAILQ